MLNVILLCCFSLSLIYTYKDIVGPIYSSDEIFLATSLQIVQKKKIFLNKSNVVLNYLIHLRRSPLKKINYL